MHLLVFLSLFNKFNLTMVKEKLKEDMHKKMLQTKLMNFKTEENDKDASDLKREVYLDDELDDKWKEDIEIILDDYKRLVTLVSSLSVSTCFQVSSVF